MPKKTFLNLSEEKRERLVDVFKTTFLKKGLSKQTVSDYVKASGIPRGSFYQYFDDLDDLYRYLFIHTLEGYQLFVLNQVRGKHLSFFDYMERIFIQDLKYVQESNHYRILHKYFTHPNLSGMSIQIMEEKRKVFVREILSQLDTMDLGRLSFDDIEDLYSTFNYIKTQYIQKVLKGVIDISIAHEKYLKILAIIRCGVKEIDYA